MCCDLLLVCLLLWFFIGVLLWCVFVQECCYVFVWIGCVEQVDEVFVFDCECCVVWYVVLGEVDQFFVVGYCMWVLLCDVVCQCECCVVCGVVVYYVFDEVDLQCGCCVDVCVGQDDFFCLVFVDELGQCLCVEFVWQQFD